MHQTINTIRRKCIECGNNGNPLNNDGLCILCEREWEKAVAKPAPARFECMTTDTATGETMALYSGVAL